MAQLKKLEGQVEFKCSADKVFEILTCKMHQVPNFCSRQVPNVEAHQGDWINVGTTRKWEFVIDGKSEFLWEKVEAVDEKNRMIHRTFFDGEFMKAHYKELASKIHVLPKGDGCCMVKSVIEYEKLDEAAPEPHKLLHFGLSVFKELGAHLAKA